MNILHIFNELSIESGYYDRLQKMSPISPQYCISCDKNTGQPFENDKYQRIKFIQIPKIERLKEYFFTSAVKKCVNNNFGDIKFSLIHSHFAYPNASAGKALSEKLNLPHIITVRGSDVLLYPRQNSFLKNTISNNLRSAELIICVSNHLKDACIDLGVLPEKIIHLPDGHDEKLFYHDGNIKKDNSILFAGNLIPVKNPIFMLEAVNKFLKSHSEFKLKIAGQGFLKDDMVQYINKHGLQNKIKFLGQLNANDLSTQMKRSNLLFLPSISEGWPNVIQESLACGTPVVASKVGGIPEMIIEGKNGFFCNIKSIDETSETLNKALFFNFKMEDLLKMPNQFSRDKIIKKLFEVYAQIGNHKN